MKLSEKILEADLAASFPVLRGRPKKGNAKLRFVQIYDRNTRLKTGCCYIVCASQLKGEEFELPADCLFLILSSQPVLGWQDSIRIAIDPDIEESEERLSGFVHKVLNEVLHIFEFYQDWEDKLIELQMNRGSIRDYLEASLPVFHGTLLLMESNQTLYAVASDSPVSGEYAQFRTNRELIDDINFLLRGRSFSEYDKSDLPYSCVSSDGKRKAVFMNIRHSKSTTHRLCCLGNDSLETAKSSELLSALQPFIRYSLYHVISENEIKNDTLTKVLQRILNDRSFDYQEASQCLSALDWQVNQKYLCMVIATTYIDQRKLTSQEICAYMERHYPFCTGFPFRDDIVIFFNMSLTKMSTEELMEKQVHFLKESALKAGYSREVSGHMNLRRQYIQAATAMDVGARMNPYDWVHKFDDVSMTFLMEQCTRRLPAHMLAHPKLLELKEMDEKNGTEYLKTLRVYLDQAQNAVHAAKALYIHRSTFLYRMDKIKQMLESELDDPEEILYLQLSFRLLEQEERKNNH